MNLPAILKKRDLLETFRESVSPRHEPSHSHRQPSVEDEVENEEEEETASHPALRVVNAAEMTAQRAKRCCSKLSSSSASKRYQS